MEVIVKKIGSYAFILAIVLGASIDKAHAGVFCLATDSVNGTTLIGQGYGFSEEQAKIIAEADLRERAKIWMEENGAYGAIVPNFECSSTDHHGGNGYGY
jgi:hypothetical protein